MRDRSHLNESIENDHRKRRMRIKWDYRFDKFWEEYFKDIPKDNTNLELEIKYALKLFAFIGE